MEVDDTKMSEKQKIKLPPERGKIKVKIFRGIVKTVVTAIGIQGNKEAGYRSSASTSSPAG